MHIWQQTSVAD